MRIATNMAALSACNQLRRNDNSVAKSLERLSSGYKINSAGDDPVGSAISKKMKMQIRGLERANQNASDGISVVETAEGALQEITSMLQRIRELAVQGATDTSTDDDRTAIMNEISQIEEEIDRIADDTEFNTRSLLNGDLARNTYTNRNEVSISYLSTGVEPKVYNMSVTPGVKSRLITEPAVSTFTVSGTFSINGKQININAGDTFEDVYNQMVSIGDYLDLDVSRTGTSMELTSVYAGSKYDIKVEASSEALANQLGLNGAQQTIGRDAVVSADEYNVGGSGFAQGAIFTSEGNEVTIKATGAFEMRIKIDESLTGSNLRVQAYVLNTGTMSIQLGANEAQEMEIELPEVTSKTLGIDRINAYTSRGCSDAITYCDRAIGFVNEVRSRIGAYETRLEGAISSLDVTTENLTAALSRIEDVDMAEEMTAYTSSNVLSQAATSMLSQANQQPEKVLQLLQ